MAGTGNSVRWDDARLGSVLYENMVSVLISRLHPDARRIDGSGGDGGRDVILPLATGEEIFELKSFTGRIDHGRRSQVKRSLARAAEHRPTAWHLVVPIDPTDKEREWFEKLAFGYPFPCDWLGQAWLNEKMASHPDIPRYFLGDAKDEVIDLLRQLQQEQAALGSGVPDAVDRVVALMALLNDLDPYYRFTLAADGETVSVSLLPKYMGADRDRPLLLGGQFQFPDTEEGRAAAESFQSSLDFGTSSDIPAEFVRQLDFDGPAGLGGTFTGGALSIVANDEIPSADLKLQARVLGENGYPIAQLWFMGVRRTAGRKGAEIEFSDVGRALTLVIRFDITDAQMRLSLQYKPPLHALPAAILPALSFLAEWQPERQLGLWLQGVEIGPPLDLPEGVSDDDLRASRRLVHTVAEIQQCTGCYFPMPTEFSYDELVEVEFVRRLLAGDVLRSEWTSVQFTAPLHVLLASPFQDFLSRDEIIGFCREEELVLNLGENSMHIGRVRRTFSAARVRSRTEISSDSSPDTEIHLVLVPADDPSCETALVSPLPPPLGARRYETDRP